MDPKYFILILFCGHLNNIFFSVTKAIAIEKQTQPTLFKSAVPYVSANSQNTVNSLSQPTQLKNVSSGQPISTAKVTAGQPSTVAHASSGNPTAYTSAGQPLAYNITRQLTPTANTSSQQTVHPVFTSGRQLHTSAHASTRQPPRFVYRSTQQPSTVHTSSKKSVPPTIQNLSIQPTPAVESLPRITPGFVPEDVSHTQSPHKSNSNSIAAILVGIVLISMLIAIIMIVLCKCLRKPVSNDQNWAGRSPFADGETPDICLDNIRENEISTKRTSIISLMAWKPGKSTPLADDLEIKLFESSENIDDSNPKTEKIKDQGNGTSEDSADGSTIGTAVSSSDDADLPPPPPPLLDLEGQESNQSDKPTMTTVSPLPNDSTSLPPSTDCLNQVCEDHNSENKESLPPPLDSPNLTLPQGDLMKILQDSTNEIQCQEFSILPNSDQDVNESLPPPPEELL